MLLDLKYRWIILNNCIMKIIKIEYRTEVQNTVKEILCLNTAIGNYKPIFYHLLSSKLVSKNGSFFIIAHCI